MQILSIVAMDYPYNKLQDLFHCSSKTIALAKVHCILFDRDGTPPAKLKFTLGNMSDCPDVLMELSEFFNREHIKAFFLQKCNNRWPGNTCQVLEGQC